MAGIHGSGYPVLIPACVDEISDHMAASSATTVKKLRFTTHGMTVGLALYV